MSVAFTSYSACSFNASIAAPQAAIASFMSVAFTSYSACSFSRFFVFLLISFSSFEIVLLRSEIWPLSTAISPSNSLISALRSAILASDFSMLYSFSSACSLQKHAYLSYAAASFLPSAATFADRSFKRPTTFSIGVTLAPCAAVAKQIKRYTYDREEYAMATTMILQYAGSQIWQLPSATL